MSDTIQLNERSDDRGVITEPFLTIRPYDVNREVMRAIALSGAKEERGVPVRDLSRW